MYLQHIVEIFEDGPLGRREAICTEVVVIITDVSSECKAIIEGHVYHVKCRVPSCVNVAWDLFVRELEMFEGSTPGGEELRG